MHTDKFPVSYRDKESQKNISLGEIELELPDNLDEAKHIYGEGDPAKGEELLLEYAEKAYVIEKQRIHRDANRPDKPKATSNVSKFRQLSTERQEELLRQAGILPPADAQATGQAA